MSDPVTSKVLRLTFMNVIGDRRSISIRNPVENPDPIAVDSLMDVITNNEVFLASAAPLIQKVGAVTISTTTQEIV
ncbi:MAG: DUF2922 domain-containing protein [Candidatus Syntrophonatronum acetioxidans]|uniref:DUF2922 domain-containing protein n=1 Tax=Candidatus Syntrophonatronum acetioxidans TaxID=1795816 RepID=A0A424Y9S2_9FIRM|nr:MAG: DUF2922 domain-containing protein [Candidatus Syntrophonatronum acetioxidans]